MFGTKKMTVNLEGYTTQQAIRLCIELAASFPDLTFGFNEDTMKITVKGPTASVNIFKEAAKTFQ